MALPDPVIFLPGITATYLRDLYPLPPETVWGLLEGTKQFERVQLHPDDTRFEAQQPTMIKPDQVYEIAYREMMEDLRHDLSARADQPVPVYAFGHDWRQPLAILADELGAFIEEVVARTRLLRHYFQDGYSGKVTLVGHSMGGLIIAGYLGSATARQRRNVGKVITMATPWQGSFEAVIKVVTGNANMGGGRPSAREREASRLTPALYHLLPSFDGALTGADVKGKPPGFFRPECWQGSIVDSIGEYIRMYGLDPSQAQAGAPKLLARMLTTARSYIEAVRHLDLAAAGLDASDWLCIAGAGCETRVRMGLKPDGQGTAFDIDDDRDVLNEWDSGTPAERYQTGDGTVPLNGAVPPFLPKEQVVCITPKDFGSLELQDRVEARVGGFHGILPNMNMLHRLMVRFLRDQPDGRGNTWGRPLPDVAPANWKPPLPLDPKP